MDLLGACTAFVHVSDRGSFTHGAAAARIPQPVASRRIAALEKHLGAPLFDRTTRSPTLTQFGHAVLGLRQRFPPQVAAHLDQVPDRAPTQGALVARYRALAARSAWDVVHERFRHPVSRALLLWFSAATTQRVTDPGTGILPLSVTAGRARFGWTTPIGGSQALPDALVALIQDHGGSGVVDAHVERIVLDGDRAVGVRTRDGREFRAQRAVVSSLHATALPDAVGRDRLPRRYLDAIDAWQPGLTLFAVHLALTEPPRTPTPAGPLEAVATAMGTPAGMRRQLDAFDRGEPETDDPWLLAVCSSAVDPSRVPATGGATVKLLSLAPYDLAGDGPPRWDRRRDEVADGLVRRYARTVDNYEPGDELGRRAESPLDIERHNPHNVGGSCHGGALTPSQAGTNRPAPGWSDYRTPIAGLYQTGASAHPGGSVSGRPGRNAARVVLADLGIDPRELMVA
jgi:phytoene dehydrogenase-like protein